MGGSVRYGLALMERAPFTVVRVRDDWSFPWHVRRTDKWPYEGLLSRHRTEWAADKAMMKLVREWARGPATGRHGVTTGAASMGAMAPPVY